MGDGRYDTGRLTKAIETHARRHLLFDMAAVAKDTGAMINAVMLGALAAAGVLPIPAEAFEDAIRADGKAVEANLRGFRAGLAAATSAAARAADDGKRRHGAVRSVAALEAEANAIMPASAIEIVVEGLRRTAAYQDAAYAGLYLDRLKAICEADDRADAGGRLIRETARHLAVRMTFEDVIRVAEAKIAPERFARIRAGARASRTASRSASSSSSSPGSRRCARCCPPGSRSACSRWAERRGWRPHWGMEIESTALTGYLRFWALARLKRFRPRGHRYAQEQAAIEAWLALIVEAAQLSADVAIEVAECARLIKGYGDTWQRGSANYRTIEAQVIRPALAGRIARNQAADAIASARTAALVDPEGDGLAKCLAEIASRTAAVRMAAE